jgi:DNA-binding response OmpR family regulator
MAAAGFRPLALILVSIVSRCSYLRGLLSLLYVTRVNGPSATLLSDSQDAGNILNVLSDPFALTAAFIAGSVSGVLLTYLSQKHVLTRLRRVLKITVPVTNQAADSDARFVMKALVIARDPEMIGILSDAFRKKRISTQQCSSEIAVEQLSSDKFAAVVLDFDQIPGCDHVLQNLPGANKRVIVIAVASEPVAKAIASRLGASFILERPLDPGRVRDLVTSAYGRMLRDSQVYFRLAVELQVSVRRSDFTLLQCTTLNISQTGMAVNTPAVFTVGEAIQLAFAIPNTDIFVSADGKVIWDDKHGKAGISFECASSSADKAFHDWLHDHFHMNLETKCVSDTQQVAYAG